MPVEPDNKQAAPPLSEQAAALHKFLIGISLSLTVTAGATLLLRLLDTDIFMGAVGAAGLTRLYLKLF